MDSAILSQRWEEIKEILRDEYSLSDILYNTWIKDLAFGSVNGSTVTIIVPNNNSLMLGYVERKYKEPFEATISIEMNEKCNVIFAFEVDEIKKNDTVQKKAIEEFLTEGTNLSPKYSFDNFVVGSNNRLAYSACLAVAEAPGELYNPLFLYGGAGLGKTHLMHSIGHYIIDQDNKRADGVHRKILYVTSEQFTIEVIDSIRSGDAASMARLRDKYRTVDVLLVDDIQFIIGKESTQNEFFNTFNALYMSGKQIVLSSDRPPKEMSQLDERFRSRFEMGLTADIQAPDYETRMAILIRKNSESINRKLDNEILEYVASNIKSNVRELEGAYNRIIAYSKLNNVEISIESAKQALKDIILPEGSQKITPRMIASAVSDYYDIKLSVLASKRKNAELVLPRQIIMYLCREYTDATLENIAELLGRKDHSTVIHGVKKIRVEIETDQELSAAVTNIMKKLNLVSITN